jgi:hypothetical protein
MRTDIYVLQVVGFGELIICCPRFKHIGVVFAFQAAFGIGASLDVQPDILSGKVVKGHGAESLSVLLCNLKPSLCNIEHADINPRQKGSLAD